MLEEESGVRRWFEGVLLCKLDLANPFGTPSERRQGERLAPIKLFGVAVQLL